MGFWDNRRNRWALQALDRLWSAQPPPWWWPGLGPEALSRALAEAPKVRQHYAQLVNADTSVQRALGLDNALRLTDADRALLGLEADVEATPDRSGPSDAPSPSMPPAEASSGAASPQLHTFEERVHAYLAQGWEAQPSTVRRAAPIGGFVLALAAVVALVFIVMNTSALHEAILTDTEDAYWQPRGLGTEDPSLAVRVAALCIHPTQAGPRVDDAGASNDGALRCSLDASLQVTATNPKAKAWSVGMFAAPSNSAPLPYGPTPSATGPIVLRPVAETQPVGAPRRLAVNHRPGPGWLVMLGSEAPLDYDALNHAMKAWTTTLADHDTATAAQLERLSWAPMARAVGQPLTFVRVVPLIIEPENNP
ncbi:MAG: hypothetical protein AAFX99_21675 [Myxococcota bacterium]